MKAQHRFIMPGDEQKLLDFQLNRAEGIILLNSLIEVIDRYEMDGKAFLKLNTLAEKLEKSLSKDEVG